MGRAHRAEASGLLGNVFLRPVDLALRAAGVDFGRYADDFRVWLDGPTSWPTARDTVAEAASSLGLQLNAGKTRHLRTAHGVLRMLTNPDLDELKALLDADAEDGLAAVLDAFDAEVAKLSSDPKRMEFLLKVVRNRRCPHALVALQQRPELWQAVPRTWADYLKVMHIEKALDVDWLLEVATSSPTKETAAVAYHLMQVVAGLRVGREHGRQLRALRRTTIRRGCRSAAQRLRPGLGRTTGTSEALRRPRSRLVTPSNAGPSP